MKTKIQRYVLHTDLNRHTHTHTTAYFLKKPAYKYNSYNTLWCVRSKYSSQFSKQPINKYARQKQPTQLCLGRDASRAGANDMITNFYTDVTHARTRAHTHTACNTCYACCPVTGLLSARTFRWYSMKGMRTTSENALYECSRTILHFLKNHRSCIVVLWMTLKANCVQITNTKKRF